MAVAKDLHKYAGVQALNSEYASAWTEASRGTTCSSGTNDEINIAVPTGHTVLYVYCDELCSIGFDTSSGDANGNNSLRIESGKTHKFLIPNGATYVHVEGQGASGTKYCYVVTG
tara:strand:+ start:616 stop:960 length:345 start_codon:yes stop_codon:yes gene_type:complete